MDYKFNEWKKALADFQSNVEKDLEEMRFYKESMQQMRADIISELSAGHYLRDDHRIILSAPEVIIGNVDQGGALMDGEGSRVVLRAGMVGLEGVGQGGHDGAVVVLLEAHDGGGHALLLEAGADGVGQLLGGVPHGVVDDDGALAGLLLSHDAVEIDDLPAAFAPVDEAVVRGDELDVEGLDDGQGLEHLGRIGNHDVEVVFLAALQEVGGIVLVGEVLGGGDVLAEGVLGEEDLLFGAVGHHGVRPVEHAGFLEDQSALADGDGIAALDGLHGPVLHLLGVVAFHGLERHGGAEDLLGLAAGDHFGQAAFVVELHVVDDEIVDLLGLNHAAEAAEQGAGLAGGHGIDQGVFLVLDEVGVVGRALGALGVAVEVVVVVVHVADPVHAAGKFKGFHRW